MDTHANMIFVKLLQWIVDRGRVRDVAPWTSSVLDRLATEYNLLPDASRRLSALLRQAPTGITWADKGFLPMRPVAKRRLVPLLRVKCDFTDQSRPELRLKVALFGRDEHGDIVALGMRFETPEGRLSGSGADGTHDFYHAQLIASFTKGAARLPQCPGWLPVHEPAFPVDATNPIQMLLCMLVAVYGGEIIDELLQEAELRKRLVKEFNSMHSVSRYLLGVS